MNLTESLALLSSKIDQLSTVVTEAKGHLDHPEDLIFLDGTQGANRAVQASVDTVKNPATVTIKWDGYPALIFGRGDNGKFSIMDKHMFNKKDLSGRQVFSPEQFVQYDRDRGVDRSGLHQLIAEIWPGLEKSDRSKGYYWGDLLFSQPLQDQNGMYKFKANPNGIAYTVEANSEVGQLFKGKQAAIVVHQFIPPNAATTDEASPLDGGIGSDVYSGDSLKVGGEGMKKYYDEIYAAFLNKFGKKYGVKVEDNIIDIGKPEKVYTLPITPQMREDVLKGQPLTDKNEQDKNQYYA